MPRKKSKKKELFLPLMIIFILIASVILPMIAFNYYEIKYHIDNVFSKEGGTCEFECVNRDRTFYCGEYSGGQFTLDKIYEETNCYKLISYKRERWR